MAVAAAPPQSPPAVPTATNRASADMRALRIVWRRELIRFAHDRWRMVTALVQPILYLLVLGTGLSSLAGGNQAAAGNGVTLRTFMFPGVLCLSVVFTAMFSAGSIVWDREFGFLREMLVAPVGRASIVLGKCFGGATVATAQGGLLILISGLNGVPYDPVLIIELLALMLLLSFTMTAFGVFAAARIRNMQTFFGLSQMILMPMFFLSGALYPLKGLPDWLAVLTRINPLTYAVDPLRQAVLAHVGDSPLRPLFAQPVTWFGWNVPVFLEIVLVAAIGCVLLGMAVVQFQRGD